MGIFYSGVVHRSLSCVQGWHIDKRSLLWTTLTLWIASTAAQDSTPTTSPPCSGTLVDSGYIQSPNFTQAYPNNSRCSWRLLAKSNYTSVRIQFDAFSLENGYDIVDIYDEKNISRRYTGNTFPPTMILGKEARIEFSSNGSSSKPGFKARFDSHPITSPYQCMTNYTFWCTSDRKCISNNWRCDGYADCTSREDEISCPSKTADSTPMTSPPCTGTLVNSGYIQSPNYPLDYPNNAGCSWRLIAKSNYSSVRIQFEAFSLEDGYDVVDIYDEKNISRRYTGNTFPPTMILGKEARIEFSSDRTRSMPGFRARFDSHDITSPNQCTTSYTFWCTFDRKCISTNWRCDGYVDCPSREDESRCPSTATQTTVSYKNDCERIGNFWCSRSVTCVPLSYRCDRDNDCVYGEDEANCTLRTTLSPQSDCQRIGSFWCSRSSRCVPMSYKCDNYNDCTYGEDEADCANALQQQCQQAQSFWCETSRQCINSLWRCDRADDCLYGEDEQGCPFLNIGTIASIVAGSVGGVVLLVVLIIVLIRVTTARRMRGAHPRCNNVLQAAPRPPGPVWSIPATYASQFGAPQWQVGARQGTAGLPMNHYVPPPYEATMQAYATGQQAISLAQSGEVHPPSHTPAFTEPSAH